MEQPPTHSQESGNFCSNCGSQLLDGSNFCPQCGASRSGLAVPGNRPTAHIKYRNMLVQVILYIITIGIYGIYWFYVTYGELRQANGKDEGSGCLWTFLLIIPIVQLFAWWRHSSEYAEFVNHKYPGIAIFILWIVFSPAAWFLVQMDLNRAAGN